jgi:hypothetical protein
MTAKILFGVIPRVRYYLDYWKGRAAAIPEPELRRQALASIETKTFHCEGGSLYALLARDRRDEAIRFIVAYQTISDYLDNLCDRSTSLDPDDFITLHESMRHALTPGIRPVNYYRLRSEQEDNGYLADLVRTCQEVLSRAVAELPHWAFHRMVCHGLLAIYLADRKVDRQERMRRTAIRIMKEGRGATLLFFLTCWLRRRLNNV